MASNLLHHTVVFDISHHRASLREREKVCWSAGQIERKTQQLLAVTGVQDAIILVTCNRSACIVQTLDPRACQLWWFQQMDSVASYTTMLVGVSALRFVLRMAVGLESILVGEHQILGQLRDAFTQARAWGACQGDLAFLLEQVLCHAKQIRHELAFTKRDISLASLAWTQVQSTCVGEDEVSILFLGSGRIIQQHLRVFGHKSSYSKSMVCRDREKCSPLASVYDLQLYDYSDLDRATKHAQVVIAATSHLGELWRPSPQKSPNLRLSIDWSVPRNIVVADDMPQVTWINMDHVAKLQQPQRLENASVIEHAEKKVERSVLRCCEQMELRHAAPVLGDFRNQLKQWQDHYAQKAIMALTTGSEPLDVIHAAVTELADTLSDLFDEASLMPLLTQRRGICNAMINDARQLLSRGQDPERVVKLVLHKATAQLSHAPTQELRSQVMQGA